MKMKGENFCQRHSIKLPDCDYAKAGAYFVTVVSHE